MFSEEIDLAYLGRLNVEHWSRRDGTACWPSGTEHRRRRSLLRHGLPSGATRSDREVRELYEWLGEPVTDEFAAGMARWWRDHAENREENIHPDPSVFGLDLDDVRSHFAGYTARMPRMDELVTESGRPLELIEGCRAFEHPVGRLTVPRVASDAPAAG